MDSQYFVKGSAMQNWIHGSAGGRPRRLPRASMFQRNMSWTARVHKILRRARGTLRASQD